MSIRTPWGEKLDAERVLPEYPRPQMRRNSYLNLNGTWEYAITKGEDAPAAYDGTIIVPFSPEAPLSGVNRTLHADETLWYRRSFTLAEGFLPENGRVLLHFGAVDQEATVFVNGKEVARHAGGYTAFTAEITDLLQAENTLVVRVKDDTDASWQSRGKQKTKRGGIWYTPQSGIWQTVWLEAVPKQYIERLRILSSLEREQVELTVISQCEGSCTVRIGDIEHIIPINTPAAIPVPNPHAWSPEDPYLYNFTVTLAEDQVESYFGLRDTCIRADAEGIKRLFLNGKPYFHNGLLDQGYWPDGLYTPPSDEAMIFDIQTAKDMGFNLLRKHIKIEPMRWYYHCDRLGMLVWQDMINGGGQYRFSTISGPLITGIHRKDSRYKLFAREAPQGRQAYMQELTEMVQQLENVPSLVLWVPFNEGWGQFDAEKVCRYLRTLDESRPIDPASGWHDQRFGDFVSHHVYFKRYRFRRDKLGRAVALSEFGGYNLRIDGHTWSDTDYGYKRLPSKEALWSAYQKLYEEQVLPAIPEGLCAAAFTQLTDVEDELNGLLTYDRKCVKLPVEGLHKLNNRLAAASPEI